MFKVKEPKNIKITKNECGAFQKLMDRKIALKEMMADYGLEERLLWEGLKTKYNIDILSHAWTYSHKEKNLQVSHQNPDWAKERLMG